MFTGVSACKTLANVTKAKTVYVGVRFEPSLVRRIDAAAKDEEYWRSEAVRALVELGLSHYEEGEKLPKQRKRRRTREVQDVGEDIT